MSKPEKTPPEDKRAPMAHIMPLPLLVGVFVCLILLTGVTLTAADPRFDLGPWNLVIAMVIATIKATMVALIFMHLAYDKLFHALIFITALFFVGVFISLTTLDTIEYQPDIDNWPEIQAK